LPIVDLGCLIFDLEEVTLKWPFHSKIINHQSNHNRKSRLPIKEDGL
jgi:hypothetical protein